MAKFTGPEAQSGDLFGDVRPRRRKRPLQSPAASELTAARVLCRQLRRRQTRSDKMRITHLICLNLLSVLRNAEQRA